ncbi:L-serine ammonia-lyase [Yanghanlia caeni]|uniref:L-serine dehydratase n=1 Tax=Yanghanlia caeni TaxID=3064283 RepID=A0ABU1D5M1_9BURK|nr:L-serine ammonia-lyase [Alcaligenaceae bacterium LG-2]
MAIGVFDIFKIGIGPSSSHTVGPMRAARMFARAVLSAGASEPVQRVVVELYGSLGATGKGHATDTAVMLGLAGHDPETVDVERVEAYLNAIRASGRLNLLGQHEISFNADSDLPFLPFKTLPMHPNGMHCIAYAANGTVLLERSYYSVGGGFVVQADAHGHREDTSGLLPDIAQLPMPFRSGADLLRLTREHDCSIADIMRANELHWRPEHETVAGLQRIWSVMQACVQRGCRSTGELPGPFRVRRRAPELLRNLEARGGLKGDDPLTVMDYVNVYALAVNEENAAGGRVVTAPTNGAAGIVPAVLHYYSTFVEGATQKGVEDFLLTAAAIGILYKENASISGAEVGCQGEVGVACSMAAAALCAVLGGTPEQVENAAEIGMEHHLGLTCDPVGGLVQIPCIERNAIAAVKAINAARMALHGDGTHTVSLDQVIKTMRETGADMMSKYKETSQGGLAVNIVEC